jgi:hypothetical protein
LYSVLIKRALRDKIRFTAIPPSAEMMSVSNSGFLVAK